jgi:Family of unknown function (DUF5946)
MGPAPVISRSPAPLALLNRGTTCPGCGIVVAAGAGPTHAYVGAAPGCWALYRRLTSTPYARPPGSRLRRLVDDAYAVQHPGVPGRRSLQSVAVHLMGLCTLLERDAAPRRLVPVLGRMPARKTMDLHWLAPPARNGRLTVLDVIEAGFDDGHAKGVEAWARDVWKAWAPHHATVRGWLDAPCRHVG